jgi:glycosyltransferase involved in cell wall biosynthesis
MDIVVIAPPWLPVPAPAYGGTEAVVDDLAAGYAAAGHNVLLIAHPDSTCPVPRASVVPAADTVPMGRASIELEHAIGAYHLARHADVVHDHTLAGPIYSLNLPHLPVVTTHHGPFSRTMTAILGASVPRVGLVAISHSQAASTTLPVDAVVHHGVHVDRFPFGTGSGGYVAVLARMARDKGIHTAIDIARAAGVRLLIAAKMRDPREIAYFEAEVAPKLGDDAVYLGELDADAKRQFLADAVALLNPIQWREPFGMVMLESLACGTPVVGYAAGAAPEIVEHGRSGFLGHTEDDLVAGLRAIDTIDRAACRERAATEFSVERMVAGYVEVFERRRVLERSPRLSPSTIGS